MNVMLVLSRKQNEQICINDDIVLTVVRIQGGKVRLGIECPHKIPIRRSEISLEILCEDEGAAAEPLAGTESLVV